MHIQRKIVRITMFGEFYINSFFVNFACNSSLIGF